jgi:hypothetical protein
MSDGAFKFMHPLPVKSLDPGGQVSIELSGLPIRARIAAFVLEIVGTATSASSTSAFTPVTMSQLITNVDFDSDPLFVRTTGRGLHVLDRLMNGTPIASGAQSITATTGGVTARAMLRIPLSDPRASEPHDTAVPVRLIREKTLNFNFKPALTLGTSPEVTFTASQLRVFAQLVPESGDVVPTKVRIQHEDKAEATASLKAGHFTHLCIYDDTDLVVTLAEYAQLSVQMDGSNLYDRVQTQHLIAKWNEQVARDRAMELSYQPSINLDFLPIIAQPDKYKLTQVAYAESEVRVDIEAGSKTAARYLYRQAVPLRDSEMRGMMMRLGHEPEQATVAVKTSSKEALQGSEARVIRHSRLLPKRIAKA